MRSLLNNYWVTVPSELEIEETASDWMWALERYSRDEIRGACRKWVMDSKDDSHLDEAAKKKKKKKPDFGDIAHLIEQRRARILAIEMKRRKKAEPVQEERKIPTLEERRRIAAGMGLPVFTFPELSMPEPAPVRAKSQQEWEAEIGRA